MLPYNQPRHCTRCFTTLTPTETTMCADCVRKTSQPENTYQVMQHEFDQLWEITQATYPHLDKDAQEQLLRVALDWGTMQSMYWQQIFPNAKQFLSVYLPEAVQYNPFEKRG